MPYLTKNHRTAAVCTAWAKTIQIQTEVLEKLLIKGLPEHLIRLFLNLLDNAVKYTEDRGSIPLKTLTIDTRVQLLVQDNGMGIAADHLPHLFECFYRLIPQRVIEGTGLGLGIGLFDGCFSVY